MEIMEIQDASINDTNVIDDTDDIDGNQTAPSKRRRRQRRSEDRAPLASSSPPRPQGRLSEAEIASLRAAYVAGATGILLIGLRQHLRLLMVMLPPQKSEKLALAQMEQAGRQLRALRCDGWVYARRARLLLRSKRRSALVIDSLEGGRRDQVVDFLDASEPRWHLREQFLEDDLTRALLDRVTR